MFNNPYHFIMMKMGLFQNVIISYQYLRTGWWRRKLDWRQGTQGKSLLHLVNLFIVLCLVEKEKQYFKAKST